MAVIVYVAEAVIAEAAPLMTPVVALKESPAGRDGEMVHEIAVSPEFVGVRGEIVVVTTALTVVGL